MPQKLNLHIVGGDFFDDSFLFAIVITTKIMDSFCLRNNHIYRIDSHRVFNYDFHANYSNYAFSYKHNLGRYDAISSSIIFDEKERNFQIIFEIMEDTNFCQFLPCSGHIHMV